jgi:hypothetical protein
MDDNSQTDLSIIKELRYAKAKLGLLGDISEKS